MINREDGSKPVAVPSIPIPTSQMMALPGFEKHVGEFLATYEMMVVLGSGDMVISPREGVLVDRVREAILAENPDIAIREEKSNFENVAYFTRRNPAYSRKKILPFVQKAVEQ